MILPNTGEIDRKSGISDGWFLNAEHGNRNENLFGISEKSCAYFFNNLPRTDEVFRKKLFELYKNPSVFFVRCRALR